MSLASLLGIVEASHAQESRVTAAASYGQMGLVEEARLAWREVFRERCKSSLAWLLLSVCSSRD